ncbi:RluA family pseudouridine synthase [Marinigracilibium pacificum]|uniref:RluA family pseudouridine synthase n=1 Tax=Marinigracilibium pacificum TaxID=2729599 RepID=A0A848J1J4_9BACT|nr:RluA family pseudouridine synthase [Marinigracilibium pacificum]NMM49561.1 RluA family pseudouridine synthase [Marinigracilibium pacificum]
MKKFDIRDSIVYEDDDLFIINKPPHISTLEDRTSNVNILTLAKEYCEGAQICHRLDKETSGALIIAKNPETYRHVSIAFEKRKVKKVYHAIVDGLHEFKDLEATAPIKILKKGIVFIDFKEGKDALTYFDTVEAYKNHTLVACRPITGRMHQIRVHLSFLKAPITSDEAYGGKPLYLSKLKKNYNIGKHEDESPLIQRVALHAYKVSFADLTGKNIKISAPYPKDFAVAVKQLSKNR